MDKYGLQKFGIERVGLLRTWSITHVRPNWKCGVSLELYELGKTLRLLTKVEGVIPEDSLLFFFCSLNLEDIRLNILKVRDFNQTICYCATLTAAPFSYHISPIMYAHIYLHLDNSPETPKSHLKLPVMNVSAESLKVSFVKYL